MEWLRNKEKIAHDIRRLSRRDRSGEEADFEACMEHVKQAEKAKLPLSVYFDEDGRIYKPMTESSLLPKDVRNLLPELQSYITARSGEWSEFDVNPVDVWLSRLIKYFENHLLPQQIQNNLGPNGMKLSKEVAQTMNQGLENSGQFLRFVDPDIIDSVLRNGIMKTYDDIGEKAVRSYLAHQDIVNSAISHIVQQAKMKQRQGTVVLSVNPLDIFAQGIGTAGDWHSCHNPQGLYATAGLSLALDQYTAIAYCYEKETTEDGVSLPMKTWRQLIHIDLERGGAFLGRHFPVKYDSIAYTAREMVGEILAAHLDLPTPRWVNYGRRNPIVLSGTEQVETTSVDPRFNVTGNWHYHQDGYTAVSRLKAVDTQPSVVVGAEDIFCLHCGSLRFRDDEYNDIYPDLEPSNDELLPERTVLCTGCWPRHDDEHLQVCDRCNGRVEIGEEIMVETEEGAQRVCPECEQEMVRCTECGVLFEDLDLFTAHLVGWYSRTLITDEIYLCGACLRNYDECPDCDELFQVDHPNGPRHTEDGDFACHECHPEEEEDEEEGEEEEAPPVPDSTIVSRYSYRPITLNSTRLSPHLYWEGDN